MPSILAKIRALGQPNTGSRVPSNTLTSSPPPTSPTSAVFTDVGAATRVSLSPELSPNRLGQKIHPDINALLTSSTGLSSESDDERGPRISSPSEDHVGGLTPHRPRALPLVQRRRNPEGIDWESNRQGTNMATEGRDYIASPMDPVSTPIVLSATEEAPFVWPTFGRHAEQGTGALEEFGMSSGTVKSARRKSKLSVEFFKREWRRGNKTSSWTSSFRSVGTLNRSPIPSIAPASSIPPSRRSSTRRSGEPLESGLHAAGSKAASSASNPSNPADSYPTIHEDMTTLTNSRSSYHTHNTMTSAQRHHDMIDSPNTFGYPQQTPAMTSISAFTPSHYSTTSLQAPPPTLSSFEVISSMTIPDPYGETMEVASSKGQTYPASAAETRQFADQHPTKNLVRFPSMPFTFGKNTRNSSTRPQLSNIFTNEPGISSPRVRGESMRALRPRSRSEHTRRRRSAEWSAQQASAGVVSGSNEAYGWPADVSREILRLSLSPSATASPLGNTPRAPATRAHHVSSFALQSLPLSSTAPSIPHFSSPPPAAQAARLDSADTAQSLPPPPATPRISQEVGGTRQFIYLPSPNQQDSGSNFRRTKSLGDHRNSRTAQKEAATTERSGSVDVMRRESSHGMIGGGGPSSRFESSPAQKTTVTNSTNRSSLLPPTVSVTAPPPAATSSAPRRSSTTDSSRAMRHVRASTDTPRVSSMRGGKRKADDTEDSPPKKTTFADQTSPRPPRVSYSSSSHAPSSYLSYQSFKRARLSSSPMTSPEQSRPGSSGGRPTGSSSQQSETSSPRHDPSEAHTQMTSARSRTTSMSVASSRKLGLPPRDTTSISRGSIPFSAIVSPHAPSVDRNSTFHMRDPRKPPQRREVGWRLRFRTREEEGSPVQAWCFWFGFVLPMLWWYAAFSRTPKTRIVGGVDTEKVTVDDPQIEHEAITWRTRCRVTSVLFFFTYAPVIILLAIFVPKS